VNRRPPVNNPVNQAGENRSNQTHERRRTQAEAFIRFQQRSSQQGASAPWQGVVPPARSWALSVPTPGLEDDATQRGGGKRSHKSTRGSALEYAKGDPGLTHEEEINSTLAQDAALRKKAQQKVKLIEMQDTSKDVYIPSAISVSNLARLLSVRIGMCSFVLEKLILIFGL
jgi:hypothetical protein